MTNKLLILILCTLPYYLFGQNEESQKIDSIFSEWNKADVPGCALGIIRNGELIYSKGYGIADLEHNIEITSSTVFGTGSIAKHFVAFSILLLEEQGVLNQDDHIQKYLPDFPEYESAITIRNLLYHTHGIRSYGTLKYLKGISGLNHISDDAVYELIKRQKELNCNPGENYIYGNTGYFLLGKIIEKASGLSLRQFAQEHIFDPLGMKNTLFYDNHRDLLKNRAFSYSAKRGQKGFNNITIRSDHVGGGGLFTTIEDLVLWDQNFYSNKLGNGEQQLIHKMQKEGQLSNGVSTGRALGFHKSSYNGLEVVSSTGTGFGYCARILRFPDENFSVIILANREDANPTKMAYQVADIFLKSKLKSDNEKEKLSKEFTLNQLVGHYEVVPGRAVIVDVKNEKLHVHQKWDGASYPVLNTVGDIYEIPNYSAMQLVFSDLENDFTQKLTVFLNGVDYTFNRKEKIGISTPKLNDFTGEFYSSELDTSFSIYIDGEDLYVKIVNDDPMKLSLYDYHNDAFYFGDDLLRFKRSNEVVTGFELDAGNVNNLKFEKK